MASNAQRTKRRRTMKKDKLAIARGKKLKRAQGKARKAAAH